MKTLIVPDLHGRIDIAEKALSTDYKIVFVGDYLDSINISILDQIDLIKLVLKAINERNNTIGLLGNHELSYLETSKMRASGFDSITNTHLITLKEEMRNKLKPYHYESGFLISHAGISFELLRSSRYEPSKDGAEEYLKEGDFNQIGRSRGGLDYCGGLYWCDWYEEFLPIAGINQIVGHTSRYEDDDREGIKLKVGYNSINYCVDHAFRKNEFLLIDNTEVNIIEL